MKQTATIEREELMQNEFFLNDGNQLIFHGYECSEKNNDLNEPPIKLSKNDINIELIKKAQQGCKDSRDKLIKVNERLVFNIAGKFKSSPEYDDIVQIGFLALIKSIDKFDLNKKNNFSTFAYYCIYGEILNHFRDYSPIQKKKVSNFLFKKIQDFQFEYYKMYGYYPKNELIASELDVSLKDVVNTIMENQPIFSLSDTPRNCGADAEKDLTIEDVIANKIEEGYDNVIIQESLKAMLNEEQITIFNLTLQGDSRRSIARLLGRTEPKVRMEWTKIVNKLSKNFLQCNMN